MQTAYDGFLASKRPRALDVGHAPKDLSGVLYPFQAALVTEACRKGRFALFADCGLGKTFMQLEWARQMRPANGRALVVAPLGVTGQTIAEARRLGMAIRYVTAPSDDDYQITNYERLHAFTGVHYDAMVLDESSILKSVDGKTRSLILEHFTGIRYRLACTATPAPNDVSELANHAEFCGVMSRPEMLASFFVHDSGKRLSSADGWRLKSHAIDEFWRWVATWAAYVRVPSDLGFSDEGYKLPPLSVEPEVVEADHFGDGLFSTARGISEARRARRASLQQRVDRVAEMVRSSDEQALVWCELNDEARVLQETLGAEALNIEGATPAEIKMGASDRWKAGEFKVLISKPSIFGFGLNWEHCRRVFFLGIGHSYEQFYQATRRCWRFGQKRPVDVRVVISEAERDVYDLVRSKESEAAAMAEGVVANMGGAMRDELAQSVKRSEYERDERTGDGWTMMLGDCVDRIPEVKDESVGLSVFSPPFASLYTYSDSPRDMGNSKDYDQFFDHFGFLVPHLLRVTLPARRCVVHVQQVTTTKAIHGQIGWRDFRADVVRLFIEKGWIYDGEVVIDKDPQAQAIRTKSKALMFVQKNKDSAWSRPAMADYLLLFRKPGDSVIPVKTDVSNEEWIRWARPIWYGIRESETLNAAEARSEKDERHICPLQLETIERCVRLWSNPGELVLSPFAGIGSEGYESLKHGRRFVGIELKREYWNAACRNLQMAQRQQDLFA